MIENAIAVILAGGTGTRLQPLTQFRAKPSVPFGGKYRIIDFTLTNCLHSGLRRVLILTQYKSHSLQKHLRDGWSIFNPELGEYITPVPAQMQHGNKWYQGTADAIYQNSYLLERSDAEWTFILSGDHIYRMDYASMLETHLSNQADITIACMKVSTDAARQFGIVTTDKENNIIAFQEKPEIPATTENSSGASLASMGIYIFPTKLLLELLKTDSLDASSSHDFGKDIIPKLIKKYKVHAHNFGGKEGRVTPDNYWRNVSTIDSYYQANMDLLNTVPSIDLYQPDWPIRSYHSQTPPARAVPGNFGNEGIFINSILAGGTVISGSNVSHSVLFQNVFVDDEALVEDCVLFDNVKVGKDAHLRKCIIDKNVEVPDGMKIGLDIKEDKERFHITENGIIVIPKDYMF